MINILRFILFPTDFTGWNVTCAKTRPDSSEIQWLKMRSAAKNINSFNFQTIERPFRTLQSQSPREGLCELLSNEIDAISSHHYAYGASFATRSFSVILFISFFVVAFKK